MTAPREEKIYGLSACLRVFETRRDDIIRAYVEPRVVPRAKALLRWCAAERRAYHLVPADELARITKSVHHEGLCLLVRAAPEATLAGFVQALAPASPSTLVWLDGVENPHNLGAILRTAGHFGADAVVGTFPRLSGAARRVAVGAAEAVPAIGVADAAEALRALTAHGFALVATEPRGAPSLFERALPPRTCFLLGAEGPGLSTGVRALATHAVTVPGTGAVESLNVSCAAAVLLAERWRQRHAPPAVPAPTPRAPRPAGARRSLDRPRSRR